MKAVAVFLLCPCLTPICLIFSYFPLLCGKLVSSFSYIFIPYYYWCSDYIIIFHLGLYPLSFYCFLIVTIKVAWFLSFAIKNVGHPRNKRVEMNSGPFLILILLHLRSQFRSASWSTSERNKIVVSNFLLLQIVEIFDSPY